jgi:aldose sugar dehydrogenase
MCTTCHGEGLRGGQAQSLLDDKWRFGGDDLTIARTIREGQAVAGMPPFGQTLTDEEIRALVVYIRELGWRQKRDATTFAKPSPGSVTDSERHPFKLEVVAEGLETPWSVAFLPDGRILVSEKPGRLRVVDKGRLLPEAVLGTPRVFSEDQGGLLDVAVHPDYAKNGWIYLSYSDPAEDGSAMTAIVRGRLREGRFVDQETIFKAPRELYLKGGLHFGCRLVFDGKGHLFFTIGERGRGDHAQDLSRPNGKVHRVNDDGTIPPDNPFVGREGALPSIWSYGHRNPQGLALHPVTGELWEAEHGPRGGDEINRIEPGRNYGWPIITYGMNYSGTAITGLTAREGLEQPVHTWVPSIAVCAIDFYRGDRFPRWKNDLFVTALAQEELVRLSIDGEKVSGEEVLFRGIGRVRDVVSGLDGNLYVALNGPDRVVRLVPGPEGARAASGPAAAPAIVPIEDEPRHQLRFQNRHVRVFDVQFPPGYQSLVHTHLHDAVIVNVDASETTARELGGDPVVRPPRTAGETSFINYAKTPKAHRIDNTGSTPFRVVDAEIHAGCDRFSPATEGKGQTLILENERVRVTRINIEPGETVSLGPTCGLLVAVRSATLELRTKGGTRTLALPSAGFDWRESYAPLELANVGTSAFHGVDVVLK